MTFKNWIKFSLFQDQQIKNILKIIDEKEIIKLGGLNGSSNMLLISAIFERTDRSLIYICKNETEAKDCFEDLRAFGIDSSYYFPSIETTPYEYAVIDESISSQRLDVLKSLLKKEKCVIVVSLETMLFHISPKNILEPYMIDISVKDKIDIDKFIKRLIQSGYSRVQKVTVFGEFAVRGDIIDVYFSTDKDPVRIDVFDDEIELIKTFDPFSQTSKEELQEVSIPPHKEIVYGEKEIKRAKTILKKIEGDEEQKEEIIEKITNFRSFDGEQYYLHLFYEKTSLLDYFNNSFVIFNDVSSLKREEAHINNDFFENFHSTAHKRRPRVKPEDILFSIDDIYKLSEKIIEINYLEELNNPSDIVFDTKGIPVYLGDIELFKKDLEKYLADGYKIVLFAVTDIQKERLIGIFSQYGPIDDRFDFNDNGFSIFPISLSNGFISDEHKIFFINDNEIFGKKNKISRHFYTKRTDVIDSFIDLKPGDYVVHISHGIGKFLGIERVESLGQMKDYISILYADDDKIFIPVEQLNFVQKYISQEFAKPKLDRIGSKSWSKTKERVRRSVEELAKELIKLYSFRLKQKGFKFLPDTKWQKEFEARFPYEETEDQLMTLEEVKRDMESAKPMDRLICGDVGFGKTEIAIRAAFKSVMSGKQAVMLVPTTILAEQHYETFSERLQGYPINVEMLSRFRTKAEQKKITAKLKTGEIDIIIGTHRLLSADIEFKNPGLFIVDEEQRFGVRHKEKLKQVRKTLDSLSMTATPIPRTLHMSLSNIRNISLINTPPKDRQSVETYVTEFNEEILIDAMNRELSREGQIFFLYNRIKTIYTMKKYLEKLIPKARIIVAHGRMEENELEDVIHGFIHHEYDILLATTIIESGIDMPRVNTIFIDRSDKFGLSQLYQLRGRVGRSDRKAYAYLFYDPEIALTEDAMKRLRVISEYTELGSGFKIAMKDLEIRGAGNLLGPEQSGDILAVGFQLYCKLLNEAISELAPEETEELKKDKGEVSLELQYSGYIPDSYISDQRQKMEFYKRIAGIIHIEEINEIKMSLKDRFSNIPDEVGALFQLAEIRILCKDMGIIEMTEKNKKIEIKFGFSSNIDVTKLMTIINYYDGDVYIIGKSPDSVYIKLKDFNDLKQKGEYIKSILLKIYT